MAPTSLTKIKRPLTSALTTPLPHTHTDPEKYFGRNLSHVAGFWRHIQLFYTLVVRQNVLYQSNACLKTACFGDRVCRYANRACRYHFETAVTLECVRAWTSKIIVYAYVHNILGRKQNCVFQRVKYKAK